MIRPHFRNVLLAAVLLASTQSSAPAAKPKVEESVVGPVGEAGDYILSDEGGRIGFAPAKGGKVIAIFNGTAGPEVDQLFRPTGENLVEINKTFVGRARRTTTGQYNEGPLLLSPDGAHHAYLGRVGNDIVVVHDGRIVGRGPREKFFFQNSPLTLSPKGTRVFWTEVEPSPSDPQYRLVDTGKPGPWTTGASSLSVIVSADESRVAYLATSKSTKRPVLIVDGKEAGYYGSNPQFTADGKHLISAASDGKQASILVDGKPVATGARSGRIVTAPVGRRWAATIIRKNATHHDVPTLIVDGKEIADSENTVNMWFSPDGKHYAAASHHYFNRGPDYMIVDGKRGTKLKTVADREPPDWSPDCSTLVYTGASETEPVIVVWKDGNETVFPGVLADEQVAFSAKGGHYGFARRVKNQVDMLIDGKPALPNAVPGTIVFSEDGSRHGYRANHEGMVSSLVIDGQIVPDLTVGSFGMWAGGAKAPALAFSPNGKHVVAAHRGASGQQYGLWLNGKMVHTTKSSVHFTTFSPDSRHLFWMADEPPGLVVYVDGQPAVLADKQLFNGLFGVWSMDKGGTLTLVASEGKAAKRYQISAASDTSVDTLFANGTTMPVASVTPPPAAAVVTQPPTATRTTPTPAPIATAPRTAAPTVPVARPTSPPATSQPPAATQAGSATSAGALTWNDLIRRPETRPATCTVKKEYRFQGGNRVPSGSTANLVELRPTELILETTDGKIRFSAKPEETDIVAAANAGWSQLTPGQRELTYTSLLQRMDFWPYRLKLMAPFNLEGRKTRIGDSALLLSAKGNQLFVRLEGTDIAFDVEPQQTDLLAQARILAGRDGGAPGRLLEEVSGKLVSPISGQAAAIEADARPKYVVMYMGAGWCGPCQTFSPELVKLLKQKAPKKSDVVLLYISGDRSPAEAKAYATKIGIDWPTLYFKNRGQMPAFHTLFGESIPQLVVTDRHGKIFIDSAKIGTARALQQLAAML